jgi:hypothetical protein
MVWQTVTIGGSGFVGTVIADKRQWHQLVEDAIVEWNRIVIAAPPKADKLPAILETAVSLRLARNPN